MAEAKDPSEINDDEWPEEAAEGEHAIRRGYECERNPGDQTLDLRALPEAVCSKDNDDKESSTLYVAQSGRDQFEQTKQRRQDDKHLLSLEVTRKLSQKPGEREHTAARPKDTQDIDPYSRHTIKKIESSRAEPFLVKSQTGQSEHGSLRFTIDPPTQKYRSERDGSRDKQSSSSSRRVTEPEGGEIDTPVKSTIQMPGNFVQTGARPKEKIDGRDGSGNKVSASSTGLVTEPLLNFAKGSEMDHHVPSTIQMPWEREHTAARPKDTQDIDPYSRHMIKKIESSRAEQFLVKSQTGQSEHGSLRFTINPPTQKYRSERVGSRDQQSSSSSRRVTEPEGGEIDTPVKSTIQMPGNFVQTGARPKEKIDGRDGSGNQVSASSTGLVTEPLLNFAEGSEMDHHVPSTIQMPSREESQPPMARLPLATPGIYRWFLARHSTDQSLCTGSAVSNIAAPGNDPRRRRALLPPSDNITDTRSQTGQVVESRNLVLDGHQCPMHRKVPAEHDDTGTAVCNAATPVNVPGRRHAVLPINGNTSDTRSQMGQVVDDGQNLVLEGHQFPMHRNVPTEHDDLGDLELVVDEPAC